MKLYDIRLCEISESKKLQDFIHHHWKKEHILTVSDELFYFQHLDKVNHRLNFVVAENLKTREFDGIFGFILSDIYDNSKTIIPIKWGAIWKVRDDVHNSEIRNLGLALLKFVLNIYPNVSYAVLGMSGNNIAISQALHFICGSLTHYYIANRNIKQFKIAKNPVIGSDIKSTYTIHEININDTVYINNSINPYKNIEYFKGRYDRHPMYKYKFYGVYNDERLKLLLVVRKIELLGTSVLRIVDLIGSFDETGSLYTQLQDILMIENAEYIDCYNFGIDEERFLKLGFNIVDEDNTVIPDYFEPFECRNVSLHFASKKPIIIFKGDGDQDRPTISI
jgi:hypothetical protein